MIKVKFGNKLNKKRKKYFNLTKGFIGSNSNLFRKVSEQIKQSLYNAYKERKLKKRKFKIFWIYRINAALKNNKNNYSIFIGYLKKLNIFINKKILAIIAYTDLKTFYILEKIIIIFNYYLKLKIKLYYFYIKFNLKEF
jgi:large subunit ribosomal protein L20